MIARPLLQQSYRYLAGGAFCAVLHNVIMIGVANQGVGYPIALVISVAIMTPIGYAIHCAYTFEERYSWNRLRRFLGAAAAAFWICAALMFLLCTVLRLPVIIASPIATVAMFLWNFMSARWAILFGK